MDKLNVLVFVSYYYPGGKGGGPLRSISNMVALLGSEFDFSVVTRDRDAGDKKSYSGISVGAWNDVRGCKVFYLPSGIVFFTKLLGLIFSSRWNVLYLNSFFDLRMTLWGLLAARFLGRESKVLLAPRGEFSEGAMSFKTAKKRLYIKTVKSLGLLRKTIFHASTTAEADEIERVLGVDRGRIRIAMNLTMPPMASSDVREAQVDGPLKLVFLSRLARKKNLDFVLRSLASVQSTASLDVYGVFEEDSYSNECAELVARLPASIKVNFCGYVEPDDVGNVLAQYDLFYFPTLGENYGHVIAEALAVGTPVLLSDRTPWTGLETDGLGWVCPLEAPQEFVQVLNGFGSVPAGSGYRNRALVQERARKRISSDLHIQANREVFLSFQQGARGRS
ncbi:glycosyltransferase [Ectopseudomonas toyotomiensis]|uniref:Glycosyltransferase n=1 Tax=Ectopseudomonas toyotomiensis TaxID=554344 RepID=A0ABD7DXG3_9GAMM|nr:glycosyltransferase [Pseudomonas toyotomiensis]QSL92063.1 glycosyltransferase [Pseudomonas toyotomiensis]